MGLAQTVRDAVDTAIAAVGDLAVDVEYHSLVLGSYNSATDSRATTDTVITMKGVRYNSKDEERDYQRSDLEEEKLLVSATPFGAIKPTTQDYVVLDSVRYEIVRKDDLPGHPAYIFVIRAV